MDGVEGGGIDGIRGIAQAQACLKPIDSILFK